MKVVVFVDVQKDFIDGALRNEQAIAVTPKIVEFAKKCVDDDDCEIYATRDTHEQSICSLDKETGVMTPISGYKATLEGQRLQKDHCIEGTNGWMIDERLLDALQIGYSADNQPTFACTFVNKPTFGSFDLAEIIDEDFKNKVLDEIVICGFCTDICVVSNALLLRTKFPNTKITVLGGLCAGTSAEAHKNALKTMTSCQIDIA